MESTQWILVILVVVNLSFAICVTIVCGRAVGTMNTLTQVLADMNAKCKMKEELLTHSE